MQLLLYPAIRFRFQYGQRAARVAIGQLGNGLDGGFRDIELHAGDAALGIGQGMSEAAFGLRLRYEVRREIAPYIGVEWSRAYGGTARLLRAAGADREGSQIVAGLRVWY